MEPGMDANDIYSRLLRELEINRATARSDIKEVYAALDRFEAEFKPVDTLGNFWDSAPRRQTRDDEVVPSLE